MIFHNFTKIFIIAASFVACSSLVGCNNSNVTVTLEGQMGAFNESKTISTLNLTTSSNTVLRNVKDYQMPTPYFEEIHAFSYWSLDPEGKSVINDDYVIKQDTTLYAQYYGGVSDDTSYILFDASDSPLGLDRNTIAFTVNPVPKSGVHGLKFDANVGEDKKFFYNGKVSDATLSNDGYYCSFNCSGPVVIKFKGLYDAISFTKRKTEGRERRIVPITIGNDHILAVATHNYFLSFTENSMIGLTGLKAVCAGKYVKTISKNAFANCSNLEYISNFKHLKTIDSNAFLNCQKLKYFHFSSALSKVSDNAFNGCASLKKVIYYPYGETSTSSTADAYAFANCSSLEEIVFMDNISAVGASVFYNCEKLTNIYLPRSVQIVYDEAFAKCDSLTKVTFEEGSYPLRIGAGAFAHCRNLSEITFPCRTFALGEDSLMYTSLTKLDLSLLDKVVPYELDLFKGTPLASKEGKIIVNKDLLNAYQSASGWSDYKDVIVAK